MPDEVQFSARDVADLFHRLYYDLGETRHATWQNTYWMGVQVMKFPGELLMYQELVHRIRPRLIIETGTRTGGTALFLCHMLDLCAIDDARVFTIDIEPPPKPVEHPRLTSVIGSSVDEKVIESARQSATERSPIMVILDSDHRRDHVLAEMHAYAPLVTPGSYLIVEDTNVNGHPVYPNFGPGPMEAVQQFMTETPDFQIDRRCEKFILTANPSGYLRRKD